MSEAEASADDAAESPCFAIMRRYVDGLLELNQHLNLTAARDFESAWKLHVEDCAAVRILGLPKPRQIIDLGSGNGFPGVFLAAEYPEARVALVERTQKKARAIAELCERAGLKNAEVEACDGRELLGLYPQLAEGANIVSARAVGPLAQLVSIAAAWVAVGGRMVLWKSRNLSEDELAAAAPVAKEAGLEEARVIPYELDDFRGGQFVIYERKESRRPELKPDRRAKKKSVWGSARKPGARPRRRCG